MQEETRKKVKKQTLCRFYQRGRCTNKDCEFLHEGPPPLCYNLLKNGHCDTGDGFGADERVEGCIYSHDTTSRTTVRVVRTAVSVTTR